MKPERHQKRWTQEELEYLEDSWGFISLATIKKNLQRTEHAIFAKVRQLGLGRSQYAGGLFYSPRQVAHILGKCVKEVYRLCDEGTIKARRRKLVNERFYQIYIDDLMEFLKNNPDQWDSRNVELYAFGIEPNWMKEKRKQDMKIPRHHKAWTYEEERSLMFYVNAGYPMKDIAAKLDRTVNGIYRRTQKLREEGKLEPTKKMNYWTKEEIKEMFELEKQGLTDKEIAEKLGRERFHIVDKRRMLRKQGKYEGYKKGGILNV